MIFCLWNWIISGSFFLINGLNEALVFGKQLIRFSVFPVEFERLLQHIGVCDF
jgi:hypothetical protein